MLAPVKIIACSQIKKRGQFDSPALFSFDRLDGLRNADQHPGGHSIPTQDF
jgi:hypothetical protein